VTGGSVWTFIDEGVVNESVVGDALSWRVVLQPRLLVSDGDEGMGGLLKVKTLALE
jgi:hypothetical protein